MRMRIYDTKKIRGGRRAVQSGSVSEWIIFDALKWICKAMFFCMFFWIIIPVKLLTRK